MAFQVIRLLFYASVSSLVFSIMLHKLQQSYHYKIFNPGKRFYSSSLQQLLAKKSDKSGTTAMESDVKIKEGKILVIVESPSKAKTIQNFLDPNRYIVDSSVGHVRELIKSAKAAPEKYKQSFISQSLGLKVSGVGIDVNNNFEPLYDIMENKIDVIHRLKAYTESCSFVIFATDEDREGEAISWHLLETIKPTVPYKRAVFHEISKTAIEESFKNLKDIDMNLVHSQETRRILDRLAGYTLSPILWR